MTAYLSIARRAHRICLSFAHTSTHPNSIIRSSQIPRITLPSIHSSKSFTTSPPLHAVSPNRVVNKRIEDQYPYVRVVNRETNKLDPAQSTKELLSTLDSKTQTLLLLTGVPPDGLEPLVRIITKDEATTMRERDKAFVKAQKKRMAPPKQIQMSWGVAQGDLTRKLGKARDELAKGNDVDIVLAKKGGVDLPSVPERREKMEEFFQMLADVADERQTRSIGKQLAMLLLKPKKIQK